jgi:orotidine-5'-phosphate decarboxylase
MGFPALFSDKKLQALETILLKNGSYAQRTILALDPLPKQNSPSWYISLALELRGLVWGVKLNSFLYNYELPIPRELRKFRGLIKLCADVKLFDTEQTAANTIGSLAHTFDLITIHGSGRPKMLEAAACEAKRAGSMIAAVTVPTDWTTDDCIATYNRPIFGMVNELATRAANCGIEAIVCGPKDLPHLKSNSLANDLIKITANVRPKGPVKGDDQNEDRSGTPEEAMRLGADLVIIGRPITAAENPCETMKYIGTQIAIGLHNRQ